MNNYTILMNDGNLIVSVKGIDYIIDSENTIFRVIGEGMKTVFLAPFWKVVYIQVEEVEVE